MPRCHRVTKQLKTSRSRAMTTTVSDLKIVCFSFDPDLHGTASDTDTLTCQRAPNSLTRFVYSQESTHPLFLSTLSFCPSLYASLKASVYSLELGPHSYHILAICCLGLRRFVVGLLWTRSSSSRNLRRARNAPLRAAVNKTQARRLLPALHTLLILQP